MDTSLPLTDDQRSEQVHVLMTPSVRRTLERAAATMDKSLDDFLLDQGLNAARAMLADRATYTLTDTQWAEFSTRLDAPSADNPNLRALLARRPAWTE